MKKRIMSCMAAAFIALAAIPAGVTSSPQQAFACSKGETTTPEYDFSVADQVLYGSVQKVDDVYFNGELYRLATFVVEENLKGRYTRTVLTRADTDTCGYVFEQGHNYLVFANNKQGYPMAGAFDIFEGDEATNRLGILRQLNQSPPVPQPGVQQVTLYPGGDTKVSLNDQQIQVNPGLLFYQSTLYVPLTLFRDTFGYVTVWNTEENRYDIYLRSEWGGVAAQGDSAQSDFKSGSSWIPSGSDPFEVGVTYSDVQAKIDGAKYTPEHLPFTYDGVVFVPLRETSEKLGIQVEWDANTYTAKLKDTRPIIAADHPVLIMKLATSQDGVPNLIVDRIENDQAWYHYDRPVPYGETQVQLSAPFADLVRDHTIQLYLQTGARQNQLVVTKLLNDALLTRPEVRNSISLTLNRDFLGYPIDHVISTANIH